MWADDELAGDIWNGRWFKDTLASLLGEQGKAIVSRKACTLVTLKIASITKLLQTLFRLDEHLTFGTPSYSPPACVIET
jgi:hypothetical protein